MNDNVNSPKHYTTGGIECIDYIQDKLTEEEFRGYIKGNVLKYITRERHKNGNEDLKKAKWYLDRLIEIIEQNTSNEETKKIMQKILTKNVFVHSADMGIPIEEEYKRLAKKRREVTEGEQ